MNVLTVDESLPFKIETEFDAVAEDQFRLEKLDPILPNPAGGWLNIHHLNWLAKQGPKRADHPALDYQAGRALMAKLESGLISQIPSSTLASAMFMHAVRQRFIDVSIAALEQYDWPNLRTFTLMNVGWVLTSAELDGITAAKIKGQFRTHLNRIGIAADADFLLAFIHGEFDPVSQLFTLHFHGVTTAKVADLMKQLVGRWGYVQTRTGSSPLRCERINDPVRQLSYLLKIYWPSKGVRELLDGSRKRDRRGGRIPEPYHTKYLLWLDRQRLSEMSIMVGGWSRRKGGSESMRRLYFSTVEG